jgi:hypothetical protein
MHVGRKCRCQPAAFAGVVASATCVPQQACPAEPFSCTAHDGAQISAWAHWRQYPNRSVAVHATSTHHGLRLAVTRMGAGCGKATTGVAVERLGVRASGSELTSIRHVSTTSDEYAARGGLSMSKAARSSCSCNAEPVRGSIMSCILHEPASTSSGMPMHTRYQVLPLGT